MTLHHDKFSVWPDPASRRESRIGRPTGRHGSISIISTPLSEALALVAAILVGQEEFIHDQELLIARLDELVAESPDVERDGLESEPIDIAAVRATRRI